jgi:hypothetical protein
MTPKEKLATITNAIRACQDTYPMTGKPDKEAAYKNGWYDCAYHLYEVLKELK